MQSPPNEPFARPSAWRSGRDRGATGGISAGGFQRPPLPRPYQVFWLGRSVVGESAAAAAGDRSQPGGDGEDDVRLRRMRLEAVLLVAKQPLSTRKLAQLAHLADGTEARTLVRQLNAIYDDLGRAVRIEKIAGGFRMLTRAAYAPWLARLGHLPAAVRLSSPMMETLAVVAYRGPVSRADVEAVRGVSCGELLRQLMERDLIRIAGRGEELGRPYLYDTTKHFLQLFGLSSRDALPPIRWETLQIDRQIDDDSSQNPAVRDAAVRDAAVRDAAVRDAAVRDAAVRNAAVPTDGDSPA